jgi:hypothetical protein
MDRLPDLADITMRILLSLNKTSELHCAIARDNAADLKLPTVWRWSVFSRSSMLHLVQTSVLTSQPLKLTSLWQM